MGLIPRGSHAQSVSHDDMRGSVVELSATVSESPPQVTLHWNPGPFPVTSLTWYRRARGAVDWGEGWELSPDQVTVEDPWAVPGELCEYRLVRTQVSPGHPVAEGHLWAGVGVAAVERRGRVVLIVDESVSVSLAAEIARLIRDLVGDGWTVARSDVPPSATVPEVKAVIQARYAEDAANSKAVFLLGRVPVPYSGIICPDGHYDPPPEAHHRGAWPADVFYGDMDGVWTDEVVNHAIANVSGARNHNVPGDGKYDQSLIAGEHLPELAVGRVDLSRMAGVANGIPETELLRRYLDRHHAFRHRLAPFETLGERVMVDDNFANAFDISGGASGWASGIALVGNDRVEAESDWVGALRDRDYLLAYGSGPGSMTGAGGVSSITDYRETRSGAVFTMLFGSFFVDWDSDDNFLRAPLVGTADSHGLVSVWSGIPRWQLFPLAAGGTMADACHHVIREVNLPEGPFPPDDESWTNPDQTHVAIMGDPVLRSHPAKPITGLTAEVVGDQLTLKWTNPATGDPDFLGCRIYRSRVMEGPYTRVGGQTGPEEASFATRIPGAGPWHYQVRAIWRQVTASASYENPAQGIFAEAEVGQRSYEEWATGLEDAAPGGDENFDGVTNLLAHAVGAPDGRVRVMERLPSVDPEGGFTVPVSWLTSLRYEAQFSPDMEIWYAVAIKPVGGDWGLNADSGYPNQGKLVLSGGDAITVSESPSPESGFWRLVVTRGD